MVGAVGEIHLAGFARDVDAAGDALLIDSHGSPVDAAVWTLYASVIARLGYSCPAAPAAIAKLPEAEKLNALLQKLAWDAVTQHPLSCVKAK